MPKNSENLVTVNIVTWQAEEYLPKLLTALLEQTYKKFSVLIIDNDSQDRTVSIIKENFPQLNIIKNKTNIGFAKAHNQAINWTKSKYVLCLNQDVVLEKNFIKECVEFMEKNSDVSVINGKILKWDTQKQTPINKIDTAGLMVLKNHKVVDRGQSLPAENKFIRSEEIFGASGACPFFRRTSLEEVKINYEYFDEQFFSYKEDVDLAFRLRLAGCRAFYLPTAIAYHDRTSAPRTNKLRSNNLFINYHSYKNHFWVLTKNEFYINIVKYLPMIFIFELKKFFYLLFFCPKALKSLKEIFKNRTKMMSKRKFIFKNIKKISAKELRKWYV